MVRKFKGIMKSNSPSGSDRKYGRGWSRIYNHRIRGNLLFVLRLAAVLLVILAIARHRIWRLR